MSHSIADVLHEHARAAAREAAAAKAEHRFATAACWYETAADAYAELAEHTRPRNPYRAAAWLALADEQETSGYRAWDAASQAVMPV